MLNEYTDIEDAYAAIAEVKRQETEALALIEDATGCKRVFVAVPPGNQKSYAAMYAFAEMGIPIYADTFCDTDDGRGVYCCGIYHMNYTYLMEDCFFEDEPDLDGLLDELAKKHHVVVYTHPHASLTEECWDILNYDKENLRPFGDFILSKRRPQSEIDNFYKNMRRFAAKVKKDERFHITTYSEIAEKLEAENSVERVVSLDDIPSIRRQIEESFYPVTVPMSLSLSDIFLACRELLLGADKHICGKTYGFLSAPYATDKSLTFTAEEIRASAADISTDGFLPERIKVGDREIGPADWMRVALAVLDGEERVTLEPDEALPSLDAFPQMKKIRFKGTWRHSDSFEDKYLSDRLRYQSWTMRFREGYSRFAE
ncbi:MAG: hypothetical protein IJV72_01250 [Clostridia bacterium]|nr:hypothetical protein [Clostridia bacterium]